MNLSVAEATQRLYPADYPTFSAYLTQRMESAGMTPRALAEKLVYHDAVGRRHPTSQAVRNWCSRAAPRAELVVAIAQLFNDHPNGVLKLAGHTLRQVPVVSSDAELNMFAEQYRAALSHTPAHLRHLAHRMATAAVDAASPG